MWSNMWSKAILDQSGGEVKGEKCQRCNGFSRWRDATADLVLQLPNQAPYQLGHTRIFNWINAFIIHEFLKKATPNPENRTAARKNVWNVGVTMMCDR